MIKAYLASAYRGALGNDASEQEITENVERAREVGSAIRATFPGSLSLHIPHEGQEFTHRLWLKGIITDEDIIDVCCDIILEMDLVLVYGFISEGMRKEIKMAGDAGKLVVYFDVFDDDAKERIVRAIIKIQNGID